MVEPFRAPKRTLGDIDAEAASRLITAASDIALVIDTKGVVRDVAFGSEDLSREGYSNWVGQRWVDTVTIESRQKIEELISEAGGKGAPRWRQVNHPSQRGSDVPIRYSAVQLSGSGKIVAVGRDLRAIAAIQQRLVDTQQKMEVEYTRLRHAETRYRLLFQISSEPVLVVDSASLKVIEANPASMQIFAKPAKRLIGRPFPELFNADGQRRVEAYLGAVRAAGQASEVKARLAEEKVDIVVNASLFRQDATSHFLVRLTSTSGAAPHWLRAKSHLLDVVEKLPDGFVVADLERRIMSCNPAFLELAQLATEEQVRGEPLDRWLGRHTVDINVLIKTLKERGQVRNFATAIRGEYGSTDDVEVSAVAVESGEHPCYGLTIRSVSRRLDTSIHGRRAIPRSVEQLTELVGRVPLKDLVRESTDMIERLCIEAALELTDDNRASAAEMLGLSRQGLYSKLRRHGLGDLDSTND